MIRQPGRANQPSTAEATASLAAQQGELDRRIAPWRGKPLAHVPADDDLRSNFGAGPSVRAELAAASRIGQFNKCAWCEGFIHDDQARSESERLTVEHVRPVHDYPWLQARWSNLVAACGACNHGRGRRAVRRSAPIQDFPLISGQVSRLRVGELPPGVDGRELTGMRPGWCVVDPMDPAEVDPASIVQPRVASTAYSAATFPSRAREVVAWSARSGLDRSSRLRARGMIPAVLYAGGDVVSERRASWIRRAVVPRVEDLRAASDQREAHLAWTRLCARTRPSQPYSLVVWEMLASSELAGIRALYGLVVPARP